MAVLGGGAVSYERGSPVALAFRRGAGFPKSNSFPFSALQQSTPPPWIQPRGRWMVSVVNSHTNAISKRWHLWEIDLRFGLTSRVDPTIKEHALRKL